MEANSLYITMNRLDDGPGGATRFHWGLLITGSAPPAGVLHHATDEGRAAPLDLFYQRREWRSPITSRSIVVCLKVPTTRGATAQDLDQRLQAAGRTIPLMQRPIPDGEPRWTCRVWVKQALAHLQHQRIVQLQPANMGDLEAHCLAYANANLQSQGHAAIFNAPTWMTGALPAPPPRPAPAGAARATPMTGVSSAPRTTPMSGISSAPRTTPMSGVSPAPMGRGAPGPGRGGAAGGRR